MKATLFMAISANGFVAKVDGNEDFLPHKGWLQLLDFAKKYGHLIWGRKTYETVKSWGDDFIKDLEDLPIMIVSKSKKDYPEKNVVVCQTLEEVVKLAQKRGYERMFLSGGPSLNTSFIEANLVDEIILNYNPTLLGNGIKLFEESNFELKLELKNVEKISSNIVRLKYIVI